MESDSDQFCAEASRSAPNIWILFCAEADEISNEVIPRMTAKVARHEVLFFTCQLPLIAFKLHVTIRDFAESFHKSILLRDDARVNEQDIGQDSDYSYEHRNKRKVRDRVVLFTISP